MGAPINTSLTGDIWHLSIDDLLAPLPETQRLGGYGPFVINVSASSAPIDVPAKGIAGCEHVHFFQVQRIEDRRPRYRLRLGPFVTEDEAEAVLDKVRVIYPSALTATADAEDLRVMAAMQAKSDSFQPHTEKPVPTVTLTVTPVAAQIIPSISLLAAPAVAAPLSLEIVPSPPRILPSSTPAQEPVVPQVKPMPQASVAPQAKPVLQASVAPQGKPVLRASVAPQAKPVLRASVAPQAKPVNAAPPLPQKAPMVPAAQPVLHLNKPLANLDATQTVRALTQLELEDDQASRWFVIQLALADDAFDPDHLPNLDIFGAYRLYSVAGIDQGRIVHALRMGFFSEEVGARAVASYLAAYYDNPTIKRVSAAERQRFADQRLEPRKDVGATGRQAVIEITNERFVRERKSTANLSQKSG